MDSYFSFNMLELISELGLRGRNSLLLRSVGKKAQVIIEKKLQNIPNGRAMFLDFKEIELTDVSFVDETILSLQSGISSRLWGNRSIILKNLNETVKENLEAAIYLREEKYKERIPVLCLTTKGIRILGNIEKALCEAFDYLLENQSLSARQLAEEKEIEINSASNRLKKLYNYGLVLRDELVDSEGRQHIYRIPC